jgi:hypothetical protein
VLSRRAFLNGTGAAGAAALATFNPNGLVRLLAASRAAAAVPADDLARDETYWREIQQAFTLDRTLINLNNGGCCPSPRVVHEAFKRYLDLSNEAPVYYMWHCRSRSVASTSRLATKSSRRTRTIREC